MGRIGEAFAGAKKDGRAALVIYLCAGDPDLETTPRLVEAAARAGADVIELGMPFSDPTADGPAIQRASERALAGGTTLGGILDTVRAVRARGVRTPILLFGYYNPILRYGEDRLVDDAAAAGVDGFLVVDLPPEENASLREPAVRKGLDYVPLVAPTSTDARTRVAAEQATAFIYYVSLTGVTGSSGVDLAAAARRAGRLQAAVGKPVALGFGVKTPSDVRAVSAHADGVIVGSAVVQVVEQAASRDAAVEGVGRLVADLSSATPKD
ncbi:MAG: tryptophan synthase subunit alpha [Myxococcota bacterium]